MQRQDHEHIGQIFHQALELPPDEERAAFLDKQCAGKLTVECAMLQQRPQPLTMECRSGFESITESH